jgi:type II secretory pathway component PulF
MDASCKPDSLGFVTVPQLAEVFHSVGLRLSPVEIELLATGGFVCLLWCYLRLLGFLKVVPRTWLTDAAFLLSAVNSSACSSS